MNKSKFQFKGFNITKTVIERNDKQPSPKISIGFDPHAKIHQKENLFELFLGVKIEDENKAFNIEIVSSAEFEFDSDINKEILNSLFYINAPAILFPYIRAYISTLTTLSGFETITLPTLNLKHIGEELKSNTIEIS